MLKCDWKYLVSLVQHCITYINLHENTEEKLDDVMYAFQNALDLLNDKKSKEKN